MTYAGNLSSLEGVSNNSRYEFVQLDIANKKDLKHIFETFCPDAVMHLAAESHVDRSIEDPEVFITTNITGTFNLLEVSREYLERSSKHNKKNFFISSCFD